MTTWTTARPTKPGEYWLSIHPDNRAGRQPFPPVVRFYLFGGGQGKYVDGGDILDLSDPWFDGAQWTESLVPTDPFA